MSAVLANIPAAVFNSVIDAIKAIPDLKSHVGNSVYDVPPQNAKAPYVFLGPSGFTPALDYGCAPAWRFRMRIYVATSEHGRNLAWHIAFQIASALHDNYLPVSIPGFAMPIAVKVVNSGDIIDPLKLKQAFIDIDVVMASDPDQS